jgi:hypothetical protein
LRSRSDGIQSVFRFIFVLPELPDGVLGLLTSRRSPKLVDIFDLSSRMEDNGGGVGW